MNKHVVEDVLNGLRAAIDRNDLHRADFACREALADAPDDPNLWLILSEIGTRLERHGVAESLLHTAIAKGADGAAPHAALAAVEQGVSRSSSPRYLLISEWGAGFWSDVNHVIGSLLLAEMTGRIPVVNWGHKSLFSRRDGVEAWTLYFEPVSDIGRDTLLSDAYDYFPAPWDQATIANPRRGLVRSLRPIGTYGLSLLPRGENVVVSDTYLGVPELLPWIEPGDPLFGKSRLEVTRYLVDRYLHLKPTLQRSIDTFATQVMAGKSWLAVHIRGTDKVVEMEDLAEVNKQYIPWIDAFLSERPDWGIFLLTDSVPHFNVMMSRYNGRIIATNSLRSKGRGVHYSGHHPVQVGYEVISDTYLAARCDAFVGNGSSNVSLAVEALKDWPEGAYTLLGTDWRGRTMLV